MNHTEEGFNQTRDQWMQQVLAFDPVSMAIAVVVILLGLLLLRFVIKTAFTLLKVAVVILIGFGVYLGSQIIF